MMKVFIFISIVALCQAGLVPDDWLSFKQTHGKKYKSPSEEQQRLKIFLENKKKIEEHNKKFLNGQETFHMKMNQFGDLTQEEFNGLMNKYKPSPKRNTVGSVFSVPENTDIPKSIDWRQKGAVSPVKNQGSCGSCWAFSTTGALEGQIFRKTGKLVSLSEQQLVDCSTENSGCSGGLMDYAFSYIKEAGGLESEDSYPYEGKEDSCRFKKSKVVATDSGFVDIPSGNEEALKKAVGTVGPVSVAINAGLSSFQFYSGGVFSSYCPDELNHGVLVVGYGTENGQDYWLVKNSWGSNWGDNGFVKMVMNKNICGISEKASYPVV